LLALELGNEFPEQQNGPFLQLEDAASFRELLCSSELPPMESQIPISAEEAKVCSPEL